MSSLQGLLERIVPALHHAGVPFMVAGSLASAAHGLPRSTNDLDIIIDPTREALDSLLVQRPPDTYYVDVDVARNAMQQSETIEGRFVVGGLLHSSAMRDTSEPALERYYELLRARPPIARITAAAELIVAVRSLAESAIRAADPQPPRSWSALGWPIGCTGER